MKSPLLRLAPSFALAALGLAGCGGNHGDTAPDAAAGADAATGADATPSPPAPGITLFDYALAIDVTPDGKTAVFEDITTAGATAQFYDTVAGQVTQHVDIGTPDIDLATGVAANGRLSAFHGDPVQAGAWSPTAGWVDVVNPFPTGCDKNVAAGWDISADGAVVAGMLWNGCSGQAFRWSDASGTATLTKLDVLGSPDTGSSVPPTNRGTVISDDGQVIAGFAQNGAIDRSPAAWHADGSGFLLAPDVTDTPGEVLSISADGKTMAGNLGGDGFVWTKGTGIAKLVRFDVALPTDPVYPNAMTADGGLVFGGVGDAFFSTPIAFAWTATDGMRQLADVAQAGGVTLPTGVILDSVLGASADGTVVIGTAMDAAGNPKTFVLRVPASALGR